MGWFIKCHLSYWLLLWLFITILIILIIIIIIIIRLNEIIFILIFIIFEMLRYLLLACIILILNDSLICLLLILRFQRIRLLLFFMDDLLLFILITVIWKYEIIVLHLFPTIVAIFTMIRHSLIKIILFLVMLLIRIFLDLTCVVLVSWFLRVKRAIIGNHFYLRIILIWITEVWRLLLLLLLTTFRNCSIMIWLLLRRILIRLLILNQWSIRWRILIVLLVEVCCRSLKLKIRVWISSLRSSKVLRGIGWFPWI